ncbi:MAG TPA: polysaccharide deacetylase family protein [Solirubrobacteraceae bacterium]
MRPGSLVLCYHAVTDAWEDPLATAPRTLERQIKLLLARGYRAVSAEEALANRARTLHVTFDDAFRNVASVLGTLESLRVPVTIFACTRFAEDGAQFRVSEMRNRIPPDEDELLTMTWQTLRELADRGIEIGSHTISHPHLPELGEEELVAELRESRERIGDQLHRPCRFLAYPYGHHDARVDAAARAAGYIGAFTLEPPTGAFKPWAAPRVGVYRPDGWLRFALKTARMRQSMLAARAELRSRDGRAVRS